MPESNANGPLGCVRSMARTLQIFMRMTTARQISPDDVHKSFRRLSMPLSATTHPRLVPDDSARFRDDRSTDIDRGCEPGHSDLESAAGLVIGALVSTSLWLLISIIISFF